MGAFQSIVDQSWPPKPTFSVDQIPDLSGRVVLITGGNGGIGYETAKALLSKNAKVYITSRNREKAEAAVSRLKTETGKDAHFITLDLASFASIKEASQEFTRLEKKLHILFNNAGVMEPNINDLTKDGYDLTVGTNVLGHYYFTSLLMPILLAVSEEDPSKKARIVNISSGSSELVAPKNVDYSVFKGQEAKRKKLGPVNLYNQSKWMTIVYATELSRRYGDKGIVSTALNPGNIETDLQRHWGGLKRWMLGSMLNPVSFGSLTPLYAGASEHADEFDGAYLIPWARKGTPNRSTQDPSEGKRLWDWLEGQIAASN